jgi:hypothetical protein
MHTHVHTKYTQAKERQSQLGTASEASIAHIEGSLAQLRGARDSASNNRKAAWRAEQDAAEGVARLTEEQRKRRQVCESVLCVCVYLRACAWLDA